MLCCGSASSRAAGTSSRPQATPSARRSPLRQAPSRPRLLRNARSARSVALKTLLAPIDENMPSIAVLPFVNMSRDEENEYFADGLAEELLNVLSKIRGLRVASRTSAFSFKGTKVDIPTVAQKLNVATVLEG